jgi:septal ring factor EnvC (AmiA/AmiB activator)
LCGCETPLPPQARIGPVLEEIEPIEGTESLAMVAVTADPQTPGDTAVKSALEWAKKYTEKTEEADRLQQEVRTLTEDKDALTKQVAKLEKELDQAERELQEANTMLIDQRKELGAWKQNVLGYRDEMRGASQAQMEALAKILRLLGGEIQIRGASAPPPGATATKEKEISHAPDE